jgi:hypothetical protein
MEFKIGVETISSYKRLAYTPWYALAEFIDNSTQAYFDNRKRLDKALKEEGTRLFVEIVYDRDRDELTILDNSVGMNQAELEAALVVAGDTRRESSRCRYGMGMKTAACWFGDSWSIKSKKLGETQEVSFDIDVPAIAAGATKLTPKVNEVGNAADHYTEIRITKLHKKLHGRTLGKIKRFLASMYRMDISQGLVTLRWQNDPLEWQNLDDRILVNREGVPYKKVLDFDVHGHHVVGWVGVLSSGGREYAGFTVLQNNRVIRGYPDAWRPTTLYGQDTGSNDTVNQRLVGELHLDSFAVSHTKDDILWSGDEEEELEDKLKELCWDYRTVARTPYHKSKEPSGPRERVIDEAIDQLQKDLLSPEFIDQMSLEDTPVPAVVDELMTDLIAPELLTIPRIDVTVGRYRVKVFLSYNHSINDYYAMLEIEPDESVSVVINMNHPYLSFLDDSSSFTDFLRQCVFDGLATNLARIQRGTVHYNSMIVHKDRLLRVPYEVESNSALLDIETFRNSSEPTPAG